MPATNSLAEHHFYEGNRQMESGDVSGAERSFRQAIALVDDFAEAWANLGYLNSTSGKLLDAEHCYQQAIAYQPHLEEANLMFGVLLMNQKRFAESEQIYRDFLRIRPDSAPAWSNLGALLACLKREDEAEQCYRIAIESDPHFTKASFNLSYILLRQQRWEEGWRHLEDRWEYPMLASHFACPRWRGEPLTGKSLIIGFEAGHGDMIFYCRYIIELKARGARHIALICHPGLKKLFETLSGVNALFAFNDNVPETGWDYWTPPMSLPLYCQTRLETVPVPIPYLHAELTKVVAWEARLSASLAGSGLRVGLVWRGNALFENDADRSIQSLAILAPLASVKGIHFISLQKGEGEAEALNPPAGFELYTVSDQLNDFSDTAALVSCLDLVISVDTAVAHLAGAMGKLCWVLLPDYRADWRWHCDSNKTPWYPEHMRLFRQCASGNWTAVVSSVVDELKKIT